MQEADTDDNQGTLDFEEFCSFYKMMSTRRDLYLLMLTYSNHKDNMDADDIIRFLETEQKVRGRSRVCMSTSVTLIADACVLGSQKSVVDFHIILFSLG